MENVRGTTPPGDRLSRLSQASLHTNESLDIDTALQAVMNSARSLTDVPARPSSHWKMRYRWTTTWSWPSIPPTWSDFGRLPGKRRSST